MGFELSGYSIDFVNEYSSSFMRAYQYSREQMNLPKPKYGYHNTDVNEYLSARSDELKMYMADARSDGSPVGFIGGPPCPDFSVAGKQKGRTGGDGKLSLSYVKLIIEQLPDFFLFENVIGLWQTAKHRAFYDELKEMLSPYYVMTDRLRNAIEFGAPQDRDRILLFGIQKEICADVSFFRWEKYIKYSLSMVKGTKWPAAEPFKVNV